MQTDDVIANLKGHEDAYDVLVFSCGDAIPKLSENAAKQFNQDMFAVIKLFDEKGKILVGHCAAALIFDKLGIGKGRKVASHQLLKTALKGCIVTDEKSVIDGNFYTAQTELTISSLMPDLLKALK
jgi:putative intracellular protease/amidase